MPTLTTLVIFNGTNGQQPQSGLVEDSAGDLFGTTYNGGTNNAGTLFEISKTATGYASTPTILINFSATTGDHPIGSLSIDSAGDLFGTTSEFGPGISTNGGYGTVFELAKTAAGYATTPTILAGFNVTNGAIPIAGLATDAAGDLFGTTIEGSSFSNYGTVFEIAKTASGYSGTPTTLATFNYKDGSLPSGLTTDANGDLFGTTQDGGANGYGTVFEIAKTASGYASAPTILFNFNSATGAPQGGLSSTGLVMDDAGDLFGTTQGGSTTAGTVFEIAKTPTGYASAPTTLVAFNLTDGQDPNSPLLIDGAGNLWGTTVGGEGSSLVAGEVSNGDGEVFEIAKTATGYASTPTIVAGLGPDQPNAAPLHGLIADAKGDLFATSSDGGTSASGTDDGSVFEITNSGFVTASTVTAGSTLDVPGVVTIPALSISAGGIVAMQGGTLNSGTVTENSGALIIGYGTVNGADTINGTVVSSGSTLNITGNVTGSGALIVASSASTSGSSVSLGSASVNAGGTWSVAGADSVANVTDNGTITVASGHSLDVSTAVNPASTGIFQLTTKASLEISAILGTGAKIQFLGTSQANKLTIDSTAKFGTQVGTTSYAGPLLEGFTTGDIIDLKGIASTGLKLAYTSATGDLQIAGSSGNPLATLAFQTSTLGVGTFHAATDGAGGTLITHA